MEVRPSARRELSIKTTWIRVGMGRAARMAHHFPDLEICQIPRKSAFFRRVAFIGTAIIANVYGVIIIFMELFPGDPLPTPVF
jgi:hypothetical protein